MLIIGIQGDKGSANELACRQFCEKREIRDYEIKYLISSENVLRELNEGKIDLGTVAYKSSRGGLVEETQKAMGKYDFQKIGEIILEIEHVLLGTKKFPKSDYKKIISHPQALLEHKEFLQKEYPQAELIAAEDTAVAARKLKAGEYGEDALAIALKSCAEIYGLEIIEENLPANVGYETTFWLVEKEMLSF